MEVSAQCSVPQEGAGGDTNGVTGLSSPGQTGGLGRLVSPRTEPVGAAWQAMVLILNRRRRSTPAGLSPAVGRVVMTPIRFQLLAAVRATA